MWLKKTKEVLRYGKGASEQNRTRDMEIKNKLAITGREERGGSWGKEGERLSRNMYKGPMDKDNRGWGRRIECGRWG